MSTPSSKPKTILFLGATGGCGLSALRRSLSAGHTCIALCRTPSNLTSQLPGGTNPPNLHIEQGNAHDVDTLMRCLVITPTPTTTTTTTTKLTLVDTIIFSIGAKPTLRGKGGMSDPHVCEKGMTALLTALERIRSEHGVSQVGTPRIVAVSSTGITPLARDLPWLMMPMYKLLLSTAHRDKKAMEDLLVEGMGKDEEWTIIRGSLYTSGPETEGLVRVGVEDPVAGRVESLAVGYTISREDVGKWIFENLIQGVSKREGEGEGLRDGRRWVRKAVTITY
ncbi:hypothetical protein N656DRAFT_783592 [Canariomyces notabilis]|uniref:NAD(P)-binding domain-containing protein n=1 Tax=Canariomyces notabilis TaxID=2074819 RepID=A0AAN6QEV4_9PEZI|nr:hypothetical protein N656DRAFT_783592 [Canariomyces arenarius]